MNENTTVDVVDVVDATGKKTGSAQLPGALFDVQANIPLMHQVVTAQLAAARQGTHSTKTRAEVSGGGKKPWRQKGTGRARQGSTRAPQWTGGGISHGPTPRSYNQRTPKKMVVAALRGALSDRAREGRLHVVEEFVPGAQPSTKAARAVIAALGDYRRVIVVLQREETTSWLSLRNLPGVHVVGYDQLNTYDVLLADAVVFSKAALDAFVAGAAKGKSVKADGTELSSQAAQEDAK
ncbi:large subunit ribosomal protein L4 [Propionibacterium cyclohexanicum]|uniref:Large ribosomal subunit protein uL4 n=1 Tax=Propionibacterium cyclohexanicum TaxID=64702 RepID=A0A1H9S297_9ACTN|nr:50S ribosomal protein L4 [Propionibacterium cyclohexanicum]SER79127.1 large subunit ribosomal protein L4 [Propionibacterium cyclohexanicum]